VMVSSLSLAEPPLLDSSMYIVERLGS